MNRSPYCRVCRKFLPFTPDGDGPDAHPACLPPVPRAIGQLELTRSERLMMRALAENPTRTLRQAARRADLEVTSAQKAAKHVRDRLGVETYPEAVEICRERGLLDLPPLSRKARSYDRAALARERPVTELLVFDRTERGADAWLAVFDARPDVFRALLGNVLAGKVRRRPHD